ncbi:MAG: hypothetical protein KC657_19170 [Myxococcales bacterium]|nr:hypothetical protein [Myxococcales bacterium]
MKRLLLSATALATLLAAGGAGAITRQETITRARGFAYHPWTSTSANNTATCSAAYVSLYQPGDYVGVAYDWGGYMSLLSFDQQIKAGYGAGSQEPDGILDCTAGLDCSGFVSMAWSTGHFTTSSLHQTSAQIPVASIQPGDVFNQAGFHVAMFTQMNQSGEPSFIEALGYNVHVNAYGGWSHVNGYLPRKHGAMTDSAVGDPEGTLTNPIKIGALPYTDARDTRLSTSRMLDGCSIAPGTSQKGPEYVYVIDVTQPGTLTASVQDDAATDVDVQILTRLDTGSCVARNDATASATVGCGRYYIVADTYGSGTAAGPYTLSVDLAPSGQACAAVPAPPKHDPKGKLGDACAYPGNRNLPFCNGNFDADTCIYTQTTSFCSKPCATNTDCDGLPGGGCCEDISGKGELYCMTKPLCGSAGSSGVGSSGKPVPPGSSSGGASSGGASSSGDLPGSSGGDPSAAPGDDPVAGTTTREVTTGGCATSTLPAPGRAAVGLVGLVLAFALRRRRATAA